MRVAFALASLFLGLITTATSAASVSPKWDFATATDVIGMNPAYLERRLGPAKYKDTPYWTFQIGGCEITYNVDGGRVQGYEFKLRPRCESSIVDTAI